MIVQTPQRGSDACWHLYDQQGDCFVLWDSKNISVSYFRRWRCVTSPKERPPTRRVIASPGLPRSYGSVKGSKKIQIITPPLPRMPNQKHSNRFCYV
eukprot:1091354-Karenia_brevis.AAC.1